MEVTLDGGKVITAHLNDHIIRTDQSAKEWWSEFSSGPL